MDTVLISLSKLLFLLAKSCPALSDPMDYSTPAFPLPSVSPGVCSNSCSLNRWCHPTVSSLVAPFSSCPQSLQASESFPVSKFFASGGKVLKYWASASACLSTEYSGSISFWIDWFDVLTKGLSRVFSSITVWRYQFFSAQFSLWSNSHGCTWPLEKP